MGPVFGPLVGTMALVLSVTIVQPTPDPLAVEEPLRAPLAVGDTGPEVRELNERLAALGFRPSTGDEFTWRTRHAVNAFEKHHRLDRDGVWQPWHWPLLDERIVMPYRPEADRVEIDLGKQVLYVVNDHVVTTVVAISSGNGELYTNAYGSVVRARTPEGHFAFQRHINGVRVSYLGTLYRPYYFRGGYAIHGSSSVPNYPASHGCVRVTNSDMDFLVGVFDIGMPVLVYGRATARPSIEPAPLPQPVSL